MSKSAPAMSQAFQTFLAEAPDHARSWMACVSALNAASRLDPKTEHLAYLAVLSAVRLTSGIPFHVQLAKAAGASRAEVISAIVVGLPAVGNAVTQSLPIALDAWDEK